MCVSLFPPTIQLSEEMMSKRQPRQTGSFPLLGSLLWNRRLLLNSGRIESWNPALSALSGLKVRGFSFQCLPEESPLSFFWGARHNIGNWIVSEQGLWFLSAEQRYFLCRVWCPVLFQGIGFDPTCVEPSPFWVAFLLQIPFLGI